jgi:hypothetical protein
MRRTLVLLFALMTVECWFVPRPAQAQEGSKENNPAPAKAAPVQPYRLDFSFNEMLDGKVVNTRHYSLNLTSGNSDELKIGTRVPVAVSTTPGKTGDPVSSFQYMDIGTNIWAQLREHGDESVLVVRAEVSNLDLDAGGSAGLSAPVVRQIKISGDTLLVVGKPILIGSADDSSSKRQFQLEVTVTRLR